MRIIPAIDIIEGKCVRLEKGDFSKKKIYGENPVEMAKSFEDAGIQYLHLVDLDGAKSGAVKNQKILENIKKQTKLKVDFGGGVRSMEDLTKLFDAGADQINIGSLSVKNPEIIYQMLENFDANKIILSPDVINNKIAIHGWQEESDMDIFEYIKNYLSHGVQYYVCTDIEKDGMLSGSSIELYKAILSNFKREAKGIKLIASGGVKGIAELAELESAGLEGVIIGKAIYEGKISLKNLSEYVS